MKSLSPDAYEANYWDNQTLVIGIDEVGRGCLAGPVVVGAVCFPINHQPIPFVNDSKQLSKTTRESLDPLIKSQSLAYGIGQIEADTIDQIGIIAAITQAANSSISQIISKLINQNPKVIIFSDGPKPLHSLTHPSQSIIKGDAQVYSIAAASIIAKVFRDYLMKNLHQQHPDYDWTHNVGYGTKKHLAAIKEFGLTPSHRHTFCH